MGRPTLNWRLTAKRNDENSPLELQQKKMDG
jgi:hypothetical protein